MLRVSMSGMTTHWAPTTRIGWARRVGIEPASSSDLIADFLERGNVQIIWPDRRAGHEDLEVLPPQKVGGINFVAAQCPAVLLIHPESNQMQDFSRTLLDADRAFVILWLTNRTFEGWLAAQRSCNLDSAQGSRPVEPVVARGISAVKTSSKPSEGITHGCDKDYAVNAIRILQHGGYVIDGPGLEAVGFTAGLPWNDVAQLRTCADGLTAGHLYRAGRNSYRADVVELCREKVARLALNAESAAGSST